MIWIQFLSHSIFCRYGAINDMVAKGMKSKEELLLEDETPFELASIAIFKMLNEWEANGFHLPQETLPTFFECRLNKCYLNKM